MNTVLDNQISRVASVIAEGGRLHMGVTLSYVGFGSDKFWTGVMAGRQIAVNYGRHGSTGQAIMHAMDSEITAAKKMWELLRSKTGKGYAVVDAAVLVCPVTDVRMLNTWCDYRDARSTNPRRPLRHPELLGTSPRTGKQGAQVLLDITSATPDTETLVASAIADPSERFLPPLVMSRPDVPEEARFLAALKGFRC